MIYFLINNDYHWDFDLKLIPQLKGFQLALLQVPYSLKIIDEHPDFQKNICFHEKLSYSIKSLLLHSRKFIALQNQITREIKPRKEDVLLVHTEMDLTNQFIIHNFYDAGANVFLLEDGTATMCTFNMNFECPPLKERMIGFLLKKIYGFSYLNFFRVGLENIPFVNDFVFKGVIVRYGNSIQRNIPLYKLVSLKENIIIQYDEGAIFYNQALYFWYFPLEVYLRIIDKILAISLHFHPFYFKFHPADNIEFRRSIRKMIEQTYPSVEILEDEEIAEKLIEKYPLRYAITFCSTAVMNLTGKGIVPIYLNNLLLQYHNEPVFRAFEHFLDSINCYYPKRLEEVKPGFVAFPLDINKNNEKEYTIIEILKLQL